MLSTLDWFPVIRSGDDLIITNAHATWFGGDSDPEDNGETASGVNTRHNPGLLGCALPLAGHGVKSLNGTPLPMMAFGLHHDGSPNPDGAWVEVSLLGDRRSEVGDRPEPLGPELVAEGLPTPIFDLRAALLLPVIDLGPALRTRHGIDLTVAAFKHFAGDLSRGVITVSYRLKRGALYLPKPAPGAGGDASSKGAAS